MKHLATFILFLGWCIVVNAQAPLVKQWDKRFGGTGSESLTSFEQTTDGGYILGGFSFSDSSGDKTQHTRDLNYPFDKSDYWIIKIDSFGNKQWDRSFGGNRSDKLTCLEQTSDGGYILGGYTNSDSSGDITWHSYGSKDYWIVRIDSFGNKLWDKRFGGLGDDNLYAIQQTNDEGYILGGWVLSNNRGLDYWIIKLDSIGGEQWEKRFGGISRDAIYSLRQTFDGGYILGGASSSDSSGEKTQQNWGAWDTNDYWLVKIDSLGNKEWDKRFGGTDDDVLYSLVETFDKGYLLGGLSKSGIGGDKTQNNWGGNRDFWIIKVDSFGNKEWDKTFGGINAEDEFGNVSQATDGGYLIAGTSYSWIGGDKSESNLGVEQTWIVKTDSLGNKQWDKTIFTNAHEESGYVVQAKDGCYVIANNTTEGIGLYKTQQNWGGSDFWIIKFCEGQCSVIVNLTINHDTLITYHNAIAYQWFLGDSAINNATSNIYIATQGGSYTVAVTDTNGCIATSSAVIISGIDNVTEDDVVGVVQMAVNGWQLTVGKNWLGSMTEIFDVNGRVVFKSEIRNPQSEIAPAVSRGVYLLRISSGKSSVVRKLIKL